MAITIEWEGQLVGETSNGELTKGTEVFQRMWRVLVQTGKGIGDNGIWRIAKLNGILYLLGVGSKTTSFSFAFAGIFASN